MKRETRRLIKSYIPTMRIRSAARISLDKVLIKLFKDIKPGITLDVGSQNSPYKNKIPSKKYLRLDIDEDSNPDILCDLHKIKWKSNYFDTVVATEVLEHLYDPQKAINEIHRVLKKKGTCILSTRFLYGYHPCPKDYFRYTEDGLNHLFRKFKDIKIYHHGNKIQVIWHIINTGYAKIFLNIFNPIFGRINTKKTRFPSGFVVYARK